MVQYKESAAQVVIRLGNEEIVVTDFQTRSEFDVERHYGSGRILPDGVSVKKIEHGGNMRLKGNRKDLNKHLFYTNRDRADGIIPEGAQVGTPKPGTVTILHMDGDTSEFYEVFVTTRGYEFSESETAETHYEWIAMRSSDDPQ
jgi:hypothetical protein